MKVKRQKTKWPFTEDFLRVEIFESKERFSKIEKSLKIFINTLSILEIFIKIRRLRQFLGV